MNEFRSQISLATESGLLFPIRLCVGYRPIVSFRACMIKSPGGVAYNYNC